MNAKAATIVADIPMFFREKKSGGIFSVLSIDVFFFFFSSVFFIVG